MAGIDRIAEGVGVSSMLCSYERRQVERRAGGMCRCCGRRWGDWGLVAWGAGRGYGSGGSAEMAGDGRVY